MTECPSCEQNKRAYLEQLAENGKLKAEIEELKNTIRWIMRTAKDEHYADWENEK